MRRKRLFFGVLQHFPHRRAEAVADAIQRRQCEIFFAALDRTIVSAMHVHLLGEGFLAYPKCFTMFTQRISYALLQRCSFHVTKLVC